MTTSTREQLDLEYNGASGAQWLQLRVEADRCGRLDLVEHCSDRAAEAYAADDAEQGE
jgi:hypothetical protein